jgi:hypothetical protein
MFWLMLYALIAGVCVLIVAADSSLKVTPAVGLWWPLILVKWSWKGLVAAWKL